MKKIELTGIPHKYLSFNIFLFWITYGGEGKGVL